MESDNIYTHQILMTCNSTANLDRRYLLQLNRLLNCLQVHTHPQETLDMVLMKLSQPIPNTETDRDMVIFAQ